MKKMPMMTKQDADELIEIHNEMFKDNTDPMERAIMDSAMMQTLGRALYDKATTPELVAYVVENVFDKQGAEDIERFRIDPMLAMLEIMARELFQQEEE